MSEVALLVDLSKCMACRSCQVACKAWNDLEAESTVNRGTYENPPDLSPSTWTRVTFQERETEDGVRWLFFKEQCLHCREAPCVRVCPTAALSQHPMGFVAFDQELCNGCGYCAAFCPFGIPRMDVRNPLTGEARATKCTFCQDRVTSGLEPACVKACPTGALAYGPREELVARGEARVRELRAGGSPAYPRANLYGVGLLGGLGVLYVLPESPSVYGLPEDPEGAWTLARVWQDVLQPLGEVALGATLLGLGLNWIVSRRMERQKEARHG